MPALVLHQNVGLIVNVIFVRPRKDVPCIVGRRRSAFPTLTLLSHFPPTNDGHQHRPDAFHPIPTPSDFRFNLLNPTGHVMHQQFNIQQSYALPTLYLCVLYLSENKQRLVPLTA